MRGLYTIDAGVPFLPALAAGLMDGLGGDLARATILLPSRRACLALRDAFLDAALQRGVEALLLPRMQPVGEAGTDELPLAGGGPEPEPVPEAVHPLRRQLLLARLVKSQRAAQGGITDEHAVRLAAELAAFLDEMQTEEVPLDRLDDLVPDTFAAHWQDILAFLKILGRGWPAILAEEGTVDPAERRRLLLDGVVRAWTREPPAWPVVAAGITGTVPAVARLLGHVAGLPNGTLVLPGLDPDLDEDARRSIALSPAHPQYGLTRLLEGIGADPASVRPWPARPPATPAARRRFLGEIMRPAATSEAWRRVPPPSDAALAGLERIEAPDFATEALTIALRMREALDAPGRTVALVTGDRTLGRRVAIELGRFGVDIDDTAGTPLDQSPPGSFLLLAARAVIDGLQPVPLLSLLKHPLARGGTEDGAFRRQVRAFERTVLRGPRTAGGFDGLRRALEAAHARKRPPQPPEGLRDWLAAIEEAAAPLDRLAGAGEATFAELVEAHLAFAQWLARDAQGRPDALWAREAGEAAATFMADLAEAARDFPPVAVTAYPALLAVLMGAQSVRPQAGRHPRAAILGQLESRLMSADRMLIAGLNEGVWPQRPDPSPWVNRAMRTALGLPPVEQRIGIAAHDLVMAACAPEVVLSRARKDAAGAPTTASRWLLRLQAVLEATGDKERIDADPCWAAWAASLDRPAAPPSPCPRPVPCPPLKTRPNEASVTEIETLIRDPYAFYARRILGLDALDALDEEPGAAERGTVIHAALEDFVRAWPGQLPHDALERLLEAGRKRFEEVGHHPQVRAIWWPRFLDIADWFIEQEKVRRSTAQRIMAESRGRLEIDTGTGKFLLKARADRVEIGADGGLAIIDYKTGNPPKPRDVAAGISPQLTLTGLIARGGGFAGAAGEVREALYWALGGGHKGSKSTDAGGDVASLEELVEEAGAGVARLIDWFRDPANGYPAVPRPEIAPVWSDYEHLARIDEWRGTATSTTEPESDAATAEAGT